MAERSRIQKRKNFATSDEVSAGPSRLELKPQESGVSSRCSCHLKLPAGGERALS